MRRVLQMEKFDPFRSDDPALSRELDRLRGCVHRHVHMHIKHRSPDADPPATRGADALRWLYLWDGVIFFEGGVATVPSGQQVNFGAVVSRLIPAPDKRNRVSTEKLSATQLARKRNTSTAAIQQNLIHLEYVEVHRGLHFFTELGRSVGGEYRKNHPEASDADGHMVWPVDILLADAKSNSK